MTGVNVATRAAVEDLNARFAWALDRNRYDDLRDVLAPDVHYVGTGGEFTDAEAVIASFSARTAPRTTRHGLGNLLLTAVDDVTVTALSSWHTFASNAPVPTGIGLSLVADFNDRYVRGSDGNWRIAERIIRPVFHEPSLAPLSRPPDELAGSEGAPA